MNVDAVKTMSARLANNTHNTTLANITTDLGRILTNAPSSVDGCAPMSHGIVGWMLYLIASVIVLCTRIFVWLLGFATITIPTVIFKILSISFTLTLNFSSLCVPS